MIGQQRLFDPAKVTSHQFEPVEQVVAGARRYTGESYRDVDNQHQVNRQRGWAQAQSYTRGLGKENTPRMEASYASLTDHVNAQYEFMTRPVEHGGMGLKHEIVHNDPYPVEGKPGETSAEGMAADIRKGRIKTFATASTETGVGTQVTQQAIPNDVNDRLRAVHDVFGHGGTGRGFSPSGEDAAYLNHRQMFPKEAHPALAAETRGQNSFYYFGDSPGEFPSPGTSKIDTPDWATQPGKLPKKLS